MKARRRWMKRRENVEDEEKGSRGIVAKVSDQ